MSQVRTNSLVPVGGIPAGASGGGIIQMITATSTTAETSTSTTYTDITGLTCTITPRSTSSKILIILSVTGSNNGFGMMVRLLRSSTEIGVGVAVGSRTGVTLGNFYNTDTNSTFNNTNHFLDSPATTSATTYKAQYRLGDAQQSNTVFINRTAGDANASYTARGISAITVMEISG